MQCVAACLSGCGVYTAWRAEWDSVYTPLPDYGPHEPKHVGVILGYVIPVVYSKLISRKGTVYNTTKYI